MGETVTVYMTDMSSGIHLCLLIAYMFGDLPRVLEDSVTE